VEEEEAGFIAGIGDKVEGMMSEPLE